MRQSKYAVAWATVSTVVTVASKPLSPPYTVCRAFLGLVQLCTEAVAEISWSHGPGGSHATQSTSSPHLGPSEIFLAVGVCKGDIVFLLLANSVFGWYLKHKI